MRILRRKTPEERFRLALVDIIDHQFGFKGKLKGMRIESMCLTRELNDGVTNISFQLSDKDDLAALLGYHQPQRIEGRQ